MNLFVNSGDHFNMLAKNYFVPEKVKQYLNAYFNFPKSIFEMICTLYYDLLKFSAILPSLASVELQNGILRNLLFVVKGINLASLFFVLHTYFS